MIKYFIENKNIESVNLICNLLNQLKIDIKNNKFEGAFDYFNNSKTHFDRIAEIAIEMNNEQLANSNYVFREYFRLFCNISTYFELLENRKYRFSWDKLQDCLELIKHIRYFVEPNNRLELDELFDLLTDYEKLYPKFTFTSSEYVISKSVCSLCGKSTQSLDCPHIKGHLYWGKLAQEEIQEIKEIQAICIVSHPEDKRCILESPDDISEDEKYFKLREYLDLNLPYLQNFSLSSKKEIRQKDIEIVGRNDLCPCGSNKKFKKCCGKELYYEHIRYIINPLKHVDLVNI